MTRFIFVSFLLLANRFALTLDAKETNTCILIDDQEIVSFAKQIEASIENRDPNYFNISCNLDVLVNEIIDAHQRDSDSSFNNGFRDGIRMSLDLGSIIINELGSDGAFTYIHSIQRGNTIWLIFRLISNNGVNYHEYKVEFSNDRYKITDGYFYLSGEKLSESLSHIYEKYVNTLAQNNTEDAVFVKAAEELEIIKTLYSEGKINKAYKRWNKIPEAYSASKTFLCAKMNIAAGLDQKTYLNIFKEYMALYPDEPGKYLIPLDGLVSQKYYDLVLQCLDRLDTVLMTDPLLDFFRANVFYENHDLVMAANYLAKLINVMPEFETAYLSLLNIYLAQNKFEEATELLDMMILSFNTYKEDLYPFLAQFPEYLKSPLYQEWISQ